ncbi:hypothetical protein BIW11_09424 [Tropilaelaps mercedesae]|uniref:Uncharacterized protein n=1 Tax=Tropilaelaps mercedesae TaxID=418985 RepID=A0A1V9XKL5_9ACAR|nr:hypothetical protein BIW11_09424 [Tropilaelaps mercedesae]
MEFRVFILILMLLCTNWMISGTCLSLVNNSGVAQELGTKNTQDLAWLSNPIVKPHHVQRRTVNQRRRATFAAESGQATQQLVLRTAEGGSDIVEAIRLAALLPADILNVLRTLLVPAINTTLAVPANILEQVSNSSLLGELSSKSLLAGLSGLESNASRWLHLNGSSPFNGSMTANLSLPKFSIQLPFQSAANSSGSLSNRSAMSAGAHPHQRLFNVTRAGNAARTAALIGERLLLFPVSSLLSLAHPGGQRGIRSLPITLNDAYLKHYFANLTRFLGAERGTTTTAMPAFSGDNEVSTTTVAPPKSDSS